MPMTQERALWLMAVVLLQTEDWQLGFEDEAVAEVRKAIQLAAKVGDPIGEHNGDMD